MESKRVLGKFYRYNEVGWFTEKREPILQENEEVTYSLLTYDYDTSGNMIRENRYLEYQTKDSKEGDTHTISYTYDKDNKRTKVSDCTGAVIEYVYNTIGRLTQEMQKIGDNQSQTTTYTAKIDQRLLMVSKNAGTMPLVFPTPVGDVLKLIV